ncbi:hypothetical protein DIPPA_30515 [Diplonema papillatum]|nr:hypothetical protein DIPPA_30515 [Diplonema papillatum]
MTAVQSPWETGRRGEDELQQHSPYGSAEYQYEAMPAEMAEGMGADPSMPPVDAYGYGSMEAAGYDAPAPVYGDQGYSSYQAPYADPYAPQGAYPPHPAPQYTHPRHPYPEPAEYAPYEAGHAAAKYPGHPSDMEGYSGSSDEHLDATPPPHELYPQQHPPAAQHPHHHAHDEAQQHQPAPANGVSGSSQRSRSLPHQSSDPQFFSSTGGASAGGGGHAGHHGNPASTQSPGPRAPCSEGAYPAREEQQRYTHRRPYTAADDAYTSEHPRRNTHSAPPYHPFPAAAEASPPARQGKTLAPGSGFHPNARPFYPPSHPMHSTGGAAPPNEFDGAYQMPPADAPYHTQLPQHGPAPHDTPYPMPPPGNNYPMPANLRGPPSHKGAAPYPTHPGAASAAKQGSSVPAYKRPAPGMAKGYPQHPMPPPPSAHGAGYSNAYGGVKGLQQQQKGGPDMHFEGSRGGSSYQAGWQPKGGAGYPDGQKGGGYGASGGRMPPGWSQGGKGFSGGMPPPPPPMQHGGHRVSRGSAVASFFGPPPHTAVLKGGGRSNGQTFETCRGYTTGRVPPPPPPPPAVFRSQQQQQQQQHRKLNSSAIPFSFPDAPQPFSPAEVGPQGYNKHNPAVYRSDRGHRGVPPFPYQAQHQGPYHYQHPHHQMQHHQHQHQHQHPQQHRQHQHQHQHPHSQHQQHQQHQHRQAQQGYPPYPLNHQNGGGKVGGKFSILPGKGNGNGENAADYPADSRGMRGDARGENAGDMSRVSSDSGGLTEAQNSKQLSECGGMPHTDTSDHERASTPPGLSGGGLSAGDLSSHVGSPASQQLQQDIDEQVQNHVPPPVNKPPQGHAAAASPNAAAAHRHVSAWATWLPRDGQSSCAVESEPKMAAIETVPATVP